MGAVSFPMAGLGQHVNARMSAGGCEAYAVFEHGVDWVYHPERRSPWLVVRWSQMIVHISKAVVPNAHIVEQLQVSSSPCQLPS